MRYGNEYGGYELTETGITPESVIYSFGLGEDASFETDLILKHGCTIHIFDPTPRAVAYFDKNLASFVNLQFHEYGIWSDDGTQRFYYPKDPDHVSCSIINIQETKDYFRGEVHRLRSIMAHMGHYHIDVLKLDIEGAEMQVIPDIIRCGIRPKYICIEFHTGAVYLEKIINGAGYSTIYQSNGTKTFVYENSGVPDSF